MPQREEARPIIRGSIPGRTIMDRKTICIDDLAAEAGDDFTAPFARSVGVRSTVATPLLREGIAIGAIMIRRLEVRPFTRAQTKLLETFADQAVIAIENVRLFKELQERNRDFTEALEQQTATAEILALSAVRQLTCNRSSMQSWGAPPGCARRDWPLCTGSMVK